MKRFTWSHSSPATARSSRTLAINRTVRTETTPSTTHVTARSGCTCAKARRYLLSMPSWADAMTEATKLLEGMNPEIAAARQQKAEQARKAVTISDAAETWLKRMQHEGTLRQYRSLMKLLMRYIHRWNLGKSEAERKIFIDQLDAAFCAEWYQSWKYSNSAMRQRWGVVRSFFAYLKEQGVIRENPAASIQAVAKARVYLNAPYTDRQYADTLKAAFSAATPNNENRRIISPLANTSLGNACRAASLSRIHSWLLMIDVTNTIARLPRPPYYNSLQLGFHAVVERNCCGCCGNPKSAFAYPREIAYEKSVPLRRQNP